MSDSVLPEDVRVALAAALELIKHLRKHCGDLNQLPFDLVMWSGNQKPDPNRMRQSPMWNKVGGTEVAYTTSKCTSFVNCINKHSHDLARTISRRLREEYMDVSNKARIGTWVFVGSVTTNLITVSHDFVQFVGKLIKNRTRPYADEEFIKIVNWFQPHLDAMEAEVVREAKQVALVRERKLLLNAPDPPLSGDPATTSPGANQSQPTSTARNAERDAEIVRLKQEKPERKAGVIANLIRATHPEWAQMENGKPLNAHTVRSVLSRKKKD